MNKFKLIFSQQANFGLCELTHKQTGIISGICIQLAFFSAVISIAYKDYYCGVILISYALFIFYPLSYYNMEKYRNEVKYAKRT